MYKAISTRVKSIADVKIVDSDLSEPTERPYIKIVLRMDKVEQYAERIYNWHLKVYIYYNADVRGRTKIHNMKMEDLLAEGLLDPVLVKGKEKELYISLTDEEMEFEVVDGVLIVSCYTDLNFMLEKDTADTAAENMEDIKINIK